MKLQLPTSTRTCTLFPYTTLLQSWEDDANGGDFDIFYRVSTDNGENFEPVVDLSDNLADSRSPEIAVSKHNVHVVWNDDTTGGDSDIFRSEEHTSELQSLMRISYAVSCLKKKNDEHPQHKTT